MNAITRRRLFALLIAVSLAVSLLMTGTDTAHANLTKTVIAAFKGKIVVSKAPLEAAATDEQTIARIRKDSLTELTGAQNAEDKWEWTFTYTAFLKSAGTSTLKLEFYDGTKFVASKPLSGVDPKLTVLEGDSAVSEGDGLIKGKSYTLKLMGEVKGKEVIYATSTPLVFK